jgi:hypothetical protein
LHQSSERWATWATNLIDGWCLHTSPEHYQRHVIYVKQTKSKQVSDTVFFKTKYITQPTMTPADTITKALNNLTQALKGKSNAKGLEQIEALKKLDAILNNTPETTPVQIESPTPETRRVTFNRAVKPPQGETDPEEAATSPRMHKPIRPTRTTAPIHAATINKPIANMPTSRVQKLPTPKGDIPARMDMRDRIRKYLQAKTMARIPQRNTYLRQTTRSTKRTQLIHDKETNTYLNYRQLLQHPNYKDSWAKSAANKFRHLAQGLKDGH